MVRGADRHMARLDHPVGADQQQRRAVFLGDPQFAIAASGDPFGICAIEMGAKRRAIERQSRFAFLFRKRQGQAAERRSSRCTERINRFERNCAPFDSEEGECRSRLWQRHNLGTVGRGVGRQRVQAITLQRRLWLQVGAAIADAPEQVRIAANRARQP